MSESSSSSSSQVTQTLDSLSLDQIPNKLTLISSDNQPISVEGTAAVESELLKNLIEGGCADEEIPIDNVNSTILTKIFEYCKKHAGGKYDKKDEELKKWDAEYIDVDLDTLYFLFLGANYMSVKGLLELCANRVAGMVKRKSVEEIREALRIKNDFTPEEEEAYQKQYPWAFKQYVDDEEEKEEEKESTN